MHGVLVGFTALILLWFDISTKTSLSLPFLFGGAVIALEAVILSIFVQIAITDEKRLKAERQIAVLTLLPVKLLLLFTPLLAFQIWAKKGVFLFVLGVSVFALAALLSLCRR